MTDKNDHQSRFLEAPLVRCRTASLKIKNPISRLRLHQFLGTKTTEANHSLKTDAY